MGDSCVVTHPDNAQNPGLSWKKATKEGRISLLTSSVLVSPRNLWTFLVLYLYNGSLNGSLPFIAKSAGNAAYEEHVHRHSHEDDEDFL